MIPLWVLLYGFRDVEGSLSGCFCVLTLYLGSKQEILLAIGHSAPAHALSHFRKNNREDAKPKRMSKFTQDLLMNLNRIWQNDFAALKRKPKQLNTYLWKTTKI
jgi:hypothetical protein